MDVDASYRNSWHPRPVPRQPPGTYAFQVYIALVVHVNAFSMICRELTYMLTITLGVVGNNVFRRWSPYTRSLKYITPAIHRGAAHQRAWCTCNLLYNSSQ